MCDGEEFIVGRPLVYYALSLFLGTIAYFVFYENLIIGVAFATSFIIINYKIIGYRKFIYVFIFFILGNIFNCIYFSVNLPKDNDIVRVQIINDKQYFKIGKLKGRYINIIGIYDVIKEGTYIDIKGKFTRKPNFSQGIIGEIKKENYEIEESYGTENLYTMREKLYNKFKVILNEDNAAILMALCFGEERYLDNKYREDLTTLGVVHIISVSGFHMGILFMLLGILPSNIVQCVIAFIYVIFTGSKSSTCRAFIMIIILKVGKLIYREYDPLSSLCFSAIILLCIRPYYSANVGFILSYTAVIGIILFNKKIQRMLYILPKFLNESISICLASMSLSSLYSIIIFESLSLGSVVGNVFLIPLYSLITILGNISLLFIKIDILFNFLNHIILGAMSINNLILDFLLKVTLPTITLGYCHVIFVVILFSFYVFIKKYKNKYDKLN